MPVEDVFSAVVGVDILVGVPIDSLAEEAAVVLGDLLVFDTVGLFLLDVLGDPCDEALSTGDRVSLVIDLLEQESQLMVILTEGIDGAGDRSGLTVCVVEIEVDRAQLSVIEVVGRGGEAIGDCSVVGPGATSSADSGWEELRDGLPHGA
ncbi:hypothetical protein [Brevibacterium sp. S22]|uniref:hypothetical protein n=1 Tax=Brevibacterium sp. S22 TaxID=2483794 RepID=UPI0010925215|nr:hypothetical protein [Brevibacterium sp. S22]